MGNYNDYTPEIQYNDEPSVISQVVTDKETPKPDKKKPKANGRKKVSKQPKQEADTESFVEKVKRFATSQTLRLILGIFLGLFGVYLLISFLSYFSSCIADQSVINNTAIGTSGKVSNAGGEGGARLSELLINESFGLGSLVIIVWLCAMSLKLLAGRPRFKSVDFTIKCFVALITVSLIIELLTLAINTSVNWGGYHGRYVMEFIMNFAGWTGAALLCIFMIAVFVVICLRDLVNWIMRIKKARDEKKRILAEEKAERLAKEQELLRIKREEQLEDIKAGEAVAENSEEAGQLQEEKAVSFEEDEPLYSIDDSSFEETDFGKVSEQPLPSHQITEYAPTEANETNEPNGESVAEEDNQIIKSSDNLEEDRKSESGNSNEGDDDSETGGTMIVNVNQIDQDGKRHYKSQLDYEARHKYKFPPFELMREGVTKISVDANEQLENKAKIEKTLLDFGIPIVSIEATVGPTVTLYEIVPDKGVKIARIRSLVDDIALSLSATGVRIIAPIPGKGTVGIEVANKDPQTVSMRTVIKSTKYQESKYHLPVALGSTISNEVYITDLAKMPHLLVAGATGQGKSVGLNAIVASLLYSKSPSELKFVMIDPKQVEFSLYNKLKNHYMAVIPDEADSEEPVITDMQKVEATLNSLCLEMDNRYTLLKNAHARQIEEYNAKIKDGVLNPDEGHRFLPYIVVIVDEFADLIMMSGKNVEMPIARLAQKARAVGMHVIIATQRPSTNVITGIIKANFPARVAFKVSSGVDSKTILDSTGAQQLIGRGDMLIFNNSEMVRVQCAFIDTPEVESICDYVERQAYPPGPYILPEPMLGDGDEAAGGETGPMGPRDPLFEEVARRVVSAGTASTSSLQRVYSIGFNRAGKIMDQLEAVGIVGPSHGGKPRAVLVDAVGLESILGSL